MKIFQKTIFISVTIISLLLPVRFLLIPASAQTDSNEWLQPVNLSKSGKNGDPILLIDSNGVFHAIWKDTYSYRFNYSSGDGIIWNAPKVAIFPFAYSEGILRLIPDLRGKVHAFWTDENNYLYYSRVNAEDLTSPSKWSPPQLLDIAVVGLDIAIDKNNTLHLAYMRGEATERTAGIFYRLFRDGLANWTQPTEIDNSAYLRAISPAESNIDISTTENQNNLTTIYIAWNNQPRSRLFVATSQDAGDSWEEPVEVVGPDATNIYGLPSDIMIEALNDQALILWKLGGSENKCYQRFLWTSDGGQTWEEKEEDILEDFNACPEENHLFTTDQGEFLLFTFINDQAQLLAWDGTAWSDPQPQNEFASFIDPETNRILKIECRDTTFKGNTLYVIGCDRDISGDIWITSRTIDVTKEWFPLPSIWSPPIILTESRQRISSLTSVADENNVHMIWVHSSWPEIRTDEPVIQYTRWNGNRWSIPASTLTGLRGLPVGLSASLDHQGRLLLTWINQQSGELMFSWANSERAEIPVEWAEPIILPSPSNMISSPDILVDALGRIVIYFAVNLNEGRGIYFTESYDSGQTWSQPYKVFDAVSAGWESIDIPKISLTADGRLHLLFTEYAIKGDQRLPLGLFYTQSIDGGVTWSELEGVSNQAVQWSEIIGYGEKNVHRLWQEENQSIVVVFDQISEDGGLTWGRKINLSGMSGGTSQITLTDDKAGIIHLIQLLHGDGLTIQNSTWDGSKWRPQDVEQIEIEENAILSSISAGTISQGNLNVSFLVEYIDSTSRVSNYISSLSRITDLPESNQPPIPAIISTQESVTITPEVRLNPTTTPVVTNQPDITPTATEEPNDTSSSVSPLPKDKLGFTFAGILLIIMLIIFGLYRIRQR